MEISKWGSKYTTTDYSNMSQKEIIVFHDMIDNLTQRYLREMASVLGINILEMAHYDSSALVRDLAIKEIEKEFPRSLPELDFEF